MSILDFQDDSKINVGDTVAQAPSTTFGESVGAAFDDTVARNITISEGLGIEQAESDRDTIYKQITGSDDLYKDVASKFLANSNDIYTVSKNFTKVDKRNPKVAESVDKYINQLKEEDPEKYKDLVTSEGIKENAIESRTRKALEAQDVLAGATPTTQLAAGLVGGIGANFLDPVNIAATFFGASAATGILKTAIIEAGINVGAEALIIPSRIEANEELGFKYGKEEIVMDLLSAGGFGAALPVAFKGIGKGIGLTTNKLAEWRAKGLQDLEEAFEGNFQGKTATKTLERDLHEQGFNIVDEEGSLNYKKHESGIKEVEAAHAEGRPIDTNKIDLTEDEFLNIKPESIKDPIARQQLIDFQADIIPIRGTKVGPTPTLKEEFDLPSIEDARVKNQVELQERYEAQETIDTEVQNFKDLKTETVTLDNEKGQDFVKVTKQEILDEFDDSVAVRDAIKVCGVA